MLNKFRIQFFFLLLFAGISVVSCFGQNEPVNITRSKNKVIISGKIYYIHLVQKGETIYSISRAYNIGQKELLAENPDLAYGLKEGMSLKVPERPLPRADYLLGDTAKYIYHIVTEGQTLYAIAREYNLPVDEITEHNPEVKYSNLQPRQVIKIPRKKKESVPEQSLVSNPVVNAPVLITAPAGDNGFIWHKVEKGETLFSLARRYDLKKEDIIRFNGGDSFPGLRTNDSIRIPKSQGLPLPDTLPVIKPATDTTILPGPLMADSCQCDSLRWLPHPAEMKVALILPLSIDDFLLESQDTAMSIDDAGQRFKSTTVPLEEKEIIDQNWIEFYEGFMLGLRRSRDSGTNISLKVFDAGNILKPIRLQIPELAHFNPDLIICPLIDSSYQILTDFAGLNNIPLITPVYPSSRLAVGSNVISFTPSWWLTIEKLTAWLALEPSANLVVIHPADSISQATVAILRQLLPDNLVMKETVQNDTAQAQIDLALSAGLANKVLILSEKEEYVTDIIRGLVLRSRNFDITLVGFSAWSKFRSIAIEDLHSLNLFYLAPFHTDFNTPRVHSFLKSFQGTYNFYPYRSGSMGFNYAMLGNDICEMGLHFYREYTNRMPCCMDGKTSQFLLGSYGFTRPFGTSVLQKNNWLLVNYQRSLDLVISPF
ncbi:MAG: LysM peptidoglycan-binding domain-containing protein [Bacteroidales bacterium]